MNNNFHDASKIDAWIERLAYIKETYRDTYPIIWYDLKIEAEEKRTLKSLIQGNKSINFFQYYAEVLQFAQSLGISFILIASCDFDEQRFGQDLESVLTCHRSLEKFEKEELLKDLSKDLSDEMIKGIRVYAFYTLLEALTEAHVKEEEEEMTVMADIKDIVKQFRQEFTVFFYDPSLSFEAKEKLTKDVEIGEKDFYTNLTKLLQNLRSYNGPPFHLIMAGKDMEEVAVNELVCFPDLLGLYLYRDDDVLDKIKHRKIDKTRTLEELIPKIKQGLRTRSKLRSSFPAFAPDFDDWDRSHIKYVHHYLKGLINFKNQKQAKEDFINLTKAVYQDKNKLLFQFENEYKKYNKERILYWYTRNSPIYKMINNCLRIATSDSILAGRFALKDMERAIRESYQEKDKDFNGLLYRRASLSVEEWEKLERNVGKEIEMYGFLSTTLNKDVAVNLFEFDPQNSIFITIVVPPLPELDDQGFADLSKISDFPNEQEILFNVRSKFQILQATTAQIDDRGTEARHLVLLFGAQRLRKYMTQKKPSINVALEFSSQEIIQCNLCKRDSNLFGFQYEKIQVRCLDCLIKHPVPKDIIILSLNRNDIKNMKRVEAEIPGKILQFTRRAASFSLSDYKCCDCKATGKQSYYKWITQDGNDLQQCSECFEKKKEIKTEFFVSETYPYTVWLEDQKEWEKINADYQAGFLNNSQYEDEGDVYLEVQDYNRIIEYSKRVLKKLKLTRFREKKKMKTYRILGMAFVNLEQFDEAKICFKVGLHFGEFVQDLMTISLYNNLAELYSIQDDFEEAEKNYKRALDMAKLVYGEKHLEVARSENGLTRIYINSRQEEQALEQSKTALDKTKRICGENHPETAASYRNLAIIYQILGRNEDAKENSIKAFTIINAIFGENHPRTAASYNNLAEIFQDFGQHKRGIEYLEKVIKIVKFFYGDRHSQIVAAYNGLGFSYEYLGRFEETKKYFEKALEIIKSIKGEGHTTVAALYNNLALVYRSLEEFEIARDLHIKALKIENSSYGEGPHPNIATSYTNLALVNQDLEEPEKAFLYAVKSLEMTISIYGEMHKDTANSYNNLARCYEAFGNFSKSLENYTKALNISKHVNGEKHLDTANYYFNLGCTLAVRGKNQEAREGLSRAYQIRKEILGAEHREATEAEKTLRNFERRIISV